ncbi:MAG: Zn-ribbon domain-containing OB-fold protein [Candidatus Odinarchaeota archaeon]
MSDQSVPMLWRRIKAVYNLQGRLCRTCGTKYFPPIPLCPKCRRKTDFIDFQLSGLGKIYSYTVIHDPPSGFKDLAPYVIALVRLDEGPLVLSQIVDVNNDQLKIGMSVQVVFRRIGDAGRTGVLRYAYKFRPLPEYATGHVIASIEGEEGVAHLEVPVKERERRSVRKTIEAAGARVRKIRLRRRKKEDKKNEEAKKKAKNKVK